MRYQTLLFLLTTALAQYCDGATITTRDGKTLIGELILENDQITLNQNNKPQTIPLKEITTATFAPLASATTPIYGKPRRERRAVEPTHLFVEYFADPEYKDRRLARYESQVISSWQSKDPPDPAIPARCYIRYSGTLLPKSTEDFTFTTDVEGAVRFYIDGQLKIERGEHNPSNQAKTTVPLKANTPVAFKMEITPGRYSVYSRLSWSSRTIGGVWVPAVAFILTDTSPKAPELTIASPQDALDFRDPKSLPFDIAVTPASGKIRSVDLLNGSTVIGTMTAEPYHFDWKNPPAGQFKIKARAIDENCVTGYSQSIEISIGDTGEQKSLPAPWAQQTLGSKKTERIPGSASFANNVFKITKAGGQITEEEDAPHFVYQPISGDFEIIARLADLTQNDNRVGPLAGLMIRENMTSLDRFTAVVVGPGATMIAKRQDYWGRISSSERAEQPATWMKLVRHGSRIRAYTAPDGKTWSLLGTTKMDLPERVFAGLCNMTRDKETPAVATFDNVAINPGSPAMAYGSTGIHFRSGTFLAAEVLGFGKDGALAYNHNGQRHYIPSPEVARLIYKPVLEELAQTLSTGHTGALLGSGDFFEGDLKEITWRVTVSNIVFGPRTFDLKNGDVIALCMKDADAPALPYVITATDGSIYQCKSIKTNKETLLFEDPSLGPIELPIKELCADQGELMLLTVILNERQRGKNLTFQNQSANFPGGLAALAASGTR